MRYGSVFDLLWEIYYFYFLLYNACLVFDMEDHAAEYLPSVYSADRNIGIEDCKRRGRVSYLKQKQSAQISHGSYIIL